MNEIKYDERRVEILLEAAQPIAHASETIGNESILMRKPVRQEGGGFAQVPYLTGDAVRHGLREAATWALLDAAGLLGEELSESAVRLLFAGGVMSKQNSTVKLSQYDELCDLVPPLGLLGGCAFNRIIPGRIQCEEATLICQESQRYIPDWMLEHVGRFDAARSHVEEAQRVRMDPMLRPELRGLLREGDREAVRLRLVASETAAETDDAPMAAQTKSTMLPRTFERLAQGSLFSWGLTAQCRSELEVDTLYSMLGAWLAAPYVGGKRGTGHGRLRPLAAQNIHLRRPSDRMESVALDTLRVGDRFRAHVRERSDALREFLGRVAA